MKNLLTAKSLRVKIKEGFTLGDFIREFELRSRDEFEEILNALYYQESTRKGIWRDLKRNEKISKRKKNVSPENFSELEEIILPEVAENSSAIELPELDPKGTEPELREEEVHPEPEEIPQKDSLEELKRKEEEMSKELITLEMQHKEKVQAHKQISKEFAEIKAYLERITSEITECQRKADELTSATVEIFAEMRRLNEERKELDISLTSLREEIKKRSAVNVFVYASEIETENFDGSVSVDNDEMLKEKMSKLLMEPLSEELTIRELKTLCKLKALTDSLRSKGLSWSITFDKEEMEKLYNSSLAE